MGLLLKVGRSELILVLLELMLGLALGAGVEVRRRKLEIKEADPNLGARLEVGGRAKTRTKKLTARKMTIK